MRRIDETISQRFRELKKRKGRGSVSCRHTLRKIHIDLQHYQITEPLLFFLHSISHVTHY